MDVYAIILEVAIGLMAYWFGWFSGRKDGWIKGRKAGWNDALRVVQGVGEAMVKAMQKDQEPKA